MDNNDFDKRIDALLSEHAALMNSGFPAEKTKEFQEKVGELPEAQQVELQNLIDVSKALKSHIVPRSR